MKFLCVMTVIAIIVTSCSRENKKIKEKLSNSDSIAINYFKGDGTMDTVILVKILRNKKLIETLVSRISASSEKTNLKCGYDGSLHFFKKNSVVQDVDFRMNEPGCMFFSFKQDGNLAATKLSIEAKQLLDKLRE